MRSMIIEKIKGVLSALVVIGLISVLFTNGILWNKPRPQVFNNNHPAWKEWVLDYQKEGIVLVGIYEKPGFMNWAFDTVTIHPIRTNPKKKFRWEWLDDEVWRPIPKEAEYHIRINN